MKIAFHGAARTVTGSKHLITLKSGTQILLDCGMFQGLGKNTDNLNIQFGFEASDVSFLVLSHAHIDHSGLIPRLVNEGFKGKIFCTSATKDLTEILLEDSATIQRDDIKFVNKRRAKQGLPPIEPLYSIDDAKNVTPLIEVVNYNEWHTINNEAAVMFTDAGHIIGSASVHLRLKENNKTTALTFSGDVGRYNDVILRSPDVFPQADYILIESTYGDKLHEDAGNAVNILEQWINKTCVEKKGKLIIPSFSVGRTQELLYFLNSLSLQKRLPKIPVFVDSPLSSEATEVVKSHPENFNKQVKQLLKTDDDPFDFPGLSFTKSVDESKAINDNHQPMIIISASGMADAGRIKHHIANNIGDKHNTILMVGYCEPLSLGGRLMNGAKEVRIFGEYYKVMAEVGSMRSMSAHGDYNDLCQFLACQNPDLVKTIFIVHGEEDVQLEFQRRLVKKKFKDVIVPRLHESFNLD
ncbi:MAG: MBL fold metallo-hydrolase [Bacteroidetes bacterium]|nr:MBL fold metallo-hydrolase [Bacteroidota bacterium]MBS1642135.1 MBL fold metallo-hydrolase [Bacteroidota bacterium]MBS1671977.1 MBL fold metallo-hydrolase [Bacteroidota bacterium]